ncbi:MAG: selenocysteine-specific translation elongation factor [Planctomycetaceae bacterium]|nr:selenocysteine-specific translation elongation factor [Planctomycetaceae bacterium]
MIDQQGPDVEVLPEPFSTPNPLPRPILLGTAGHIDHGKTSLVFRLTGKDTDRLPEEKKRGISIDLGFAHFDDGPFRFGVIDVPGHERFVRQMVAGAGNIDVALLVVAADDGVMPQTREHLEILNLLGVRHGVVAVTKTDLADADMTELVIEEVRETLAETPLSDAEIIPVSSATGSGLPELKAAITRAAAAVQATIRNPAFRLPIDRVFTLAGRGTVVTGSVMHGELHNGSELQLMPDGRLLRVRSVQHHGQDVDVVDAHRRAALNLAGVSVDEISRGDELISPQSLQSSMRILAEVRCLPGAAQSLGHRMIVDLHLGTTQTPVRLRITANDGTPGRIVPGETAFVDMRCRQPVIAEWGQRFILRSSAGITIGGGRIIDPLPGMRRLRDFEQRCLAAASNREDERLSALLQLQPGITLTEAAQRLGIFADSEQELLQRSELRADVEIDPNSGQWIHRRWLDRLGRSLLRAIRLELKRQAPKRMLPREQVRRLLRSFDGGRFVDAAIRRLLQTGDLTQRGSLLGPADEQVSLTKRQQEALDTILKSISSQPATPPTRKELTAECPRLDSKDIDQLLTLCCEDGLLVPVSSDLFYLPEALDKLREQLSGLLNGQPSVTLAQMRDTFGMTRKHVVPLAEFFDGHQITRRDGDNRYAGSQLNTPLVFG